MALFELTELASYMQQDLDTASATLARSKATNYLRSALGVEFTEASRTLTERIPAGLTYQRLPGPLVSVESVEVEGTALVALTDYEVTRRGIVCPDGFGYGLTATWVTLEVTCTAGFTDPLPAGHEDLHDAAIHLAGLAYLTSPKPGLKSATTTIDDYTESETYAVSADTATRDAMALDDVTMRALRSRYGSGRPLAGTVLLR
jgi:hypothetical protein